MVQIFQASILGIIQGLTEFLPVSSSGHLIVLPQILGWKGVVNSLGFDVAAHLGTAVALIVFFWRDWVRLIISFLAQIPRGFRGIFSDPDARLLILIIIGSVPAAVVGVLFKDAIESAFRSVLLVGVWTISFGLLLWWTDRVSASDRKIKQVNFFDSIFVGIAQAIALIPGVSRSGITITASRSQKFDRSSAVRFSFLLATPAVLGAGILSAKDFHAGGNFPIFLSGFIFATISGILAIKFLLSFVQKHDFSIFVIYRVLFGIFLIAWALLIK
jgi:undecaprenyl-diphosphatase